MNIINAGFEILTPISKDVICRQIEIAARTCYKSENKITDTSATNLVRNLVARKHEAMLEHASITVKIICDRGVSHEIVRHRVASYAQESTRYCNYSKNTFCNEVTVIKPCFWDETSPEYIAWKNACIQCESAYFNLLDLGCSPQEARCVLPNSLKTEIVVTMNLREWRHFFQLRAADMTGPAHPQMKEIAVPLCRKFAEELPEIFSDISEGISD